MTRAQALAFVKRYGIVLESSRGEVPTFAEAVAGEPIQGSWWGHPKGHAIFWLTRAVRESPDVLVCRLVHVTRVPFPRWVPDSVRSAAGRLTIEAALNQLQINLPARRGRHGRASARKSHA
jgi:hypothetical protein